MSAVHLGNGTFTLHFTVIQCALWVQTSSQKCFKALLWLSRRDETRINEIICPFWLGYPAAVLFFSENCLKEEGMIIDTDNHNGADSMSAFDSDCLF